MSDIYLSDRSSAFMQIISNNKLKHALKACLKMCFLECITSKQTGDSVWRAPTWNYVNSRAQLLAKRFKRIIVSYLIISGGSHLRGYSVAFFVEERTVNMKIRKIGKRIVWPYREYIHIGKLVDLWCHLHVTGDTWVLCIPHVTKWVIVCIFECCKNRYWRIYIACNNCPESAFAG